MTLLALRIGNDVTFLTQITDDIHFSICGEVGGWLFVAGAAVRDILGDSRSVKCCIFRRKCVSRMGRVRSPKRRVRDDDFILGHRRIILGYFYWRKHSDTFTWNLRLKIFWQAQYLVRFEVDFACSAHCKWRFNCDPDQSWDSFCLAGTVFAEFEGWLYLLRALEMTLHFWRRSLMTFILRGRCSIWWGSRLTLLAPRIVNDVSTVTRINHEIHFAWQAQ